MSTATVDVRARLPRDLTWIAGLALTLLTLGWLHERRWGVDAHAYWAAWRGPMYDGAPDQLDAYLYSPAFAQLTWPLAQAPWPVFLVVWTVACVAAFTWLLWPLGWRWVLPLLFCCTPEILAGNVFWVFALVAVLGTRYPALWAFPVLTKVAPGVGAVWHLARGEWRAVGIAAGTTALVAGVSLALAPQLWLDWWDLLRTSLGTSGTGNRGLAPPLVVRAPLALVLVVWCARTDRRWGIPVSMVLACPVTGIANFTILAALPRLAARDTSEERS